MALLQMLYGIRPWLYWLSSYLWDVVCFLVPMAAFLGIYWIFGIDEFIGRSQCVWTLLLSMAAFAWAAIPFVYSFSFAFTSAPKGYCLIVMWNIVTGKAVLFIERICLRVPLRFLYESELHVSHTFYRKFR